MPCEMQNSFYVAFDSTLDVSLDMATMRNVSSVDIIVAICNKLGLDREVHWIPYFIVGVCHFQGRTARFILESLCGLVNGWKFAKAYDSNTISFYYDGWRENDGWAPIV